MNQYDSKGRFVAVVSAIILAYLAAACVVHFKYQKEKHVLIDYSHGYKQDTSEIQRQDTVHGRK
jgi:hypothetical protein